MQQVILAQPSPSALPPHTSSASPARHHHVEPLRVTLLAPTRGGVERLRRLLEGCEGLESGPRLLIAGLAGPPPTLVTPLALCDMSALSAQHAVNMLGDPGLLRRRPFVVALIKPEDLLMQRLARAAGQLIGAVAPPDLAPAQLATALRLLGAPLASGGSQLWLAGLRPPDGPALAAGQADLQLLRLLLRSGKLAEAAATVGYTRRGLQAQVAGLSQRLAVRAPQGRRSTQAIADSLLTALAGGPGAPLALSS